MESMEGRKKLAFKAGQVIQGPVKPFVKIQFPDTKSPRCANCFKLPINLVLYHCEKCTLISYCSKQCQIEDWWFAHNVECLTLRKLIRHQKELLFGPYSYFISMVARTCAHLQYHPEREFEPLGLYNGSSTRSIHDLLVHPINGGGGVDKALEDLAEQLSPLVFGQRWTKAEICKILGIWNITEFRLLDESGEVEIGGGLFPEMSAFNHSCCPNASPVYNPENYWAMEVRCIEDVPEGEPPLISYLPGILNREARQGELKRRFNFECRCELCETEKEGGPATDYEQLTRISNYILSGSAMWEGVGFEGIVELRDKAIQLCRPALHTYDERVTRFATRVSHYLADNYVEKRLGRIGNKDSVRKLADDTLSRIEISFGKEHFEYKRARARLASLIVKLPQ